MEFTNTKVLNSNTMFTRNLNIRLGTLVPALQKVEES